MQSIDQSSEKSPLEFALSYVDRGWAVLPVHYPKDGICSCGNPKCETPAKHPLGKLVRNGY